MSDSGDKRSVSTDALETLGTIIGEWAGRDAIHLAVEPAIAAHRLRPGWDVGFIDGRVGICDEPVGIVDPFLKQPVQKGQRFWLVVYPRQITSLRHVWTHPLFDSVMSETTGRTPKTDAERWLRDYAATFPARYDELMEHARDYVDNGEYWSQGDRFEGCHVPDEFWDHYEVVTGTRVKDRGSFFSCSC